MKYGKPIEISLILAQEKAGSRRFETARERYVRPSTMQPDVIKWARYLM